MTEKLLEELREGTKERLRMARQEGSQSQGWKLDAETDDMLRFFAEKGVCFPASEEDKDKMSDPLANYEIVITLKEMMKNGS